MKTRAAVAFEAKKPLEIVELDLEGPKAGEVLVEIKATGICHTDAYTLDGLDSEGIFPSILGHEGAGIVRPRVCAEAHADLAIALCFRCSMTVAPQDVDVLEGLASYIRHLRLSAPGVLLPGTDLAAIAA